MYPQLICRGLTSFHQTSALPKTVKLSLSQQKWGSLTVLPSLNSLFPVHRFHLKVENRGERGVKREREKKSITPCTFVRATGAFQHPNLIKLASKGERRLAARPGFCSVHLPWLAHRFIKMGQARQPVEAAVPCSPTGVLFTAAWKTAKRRRGSASVQEELIRAEWGEQSVENSWMDAEDSWLWERSITLWHQCSFFDDRDRYSFGHRLSKLMSF